VTETSVLLTPDQIRSFLDNGYLSIGKLLDDDLIGALQDEYDRLFTEAREDGRYRNLAIGDTDDIKEKRSADGQMLQITQMCERSILFRRLVYDERILDIAESLIGPNLQLYHDQALYKPAHQGEAVFWHQDNGYWKCVPANLVSCWLTLDDVDRTNGAMHVVPGSHRAPVNHDKSASTSALLDVASQIDESKAEVIDLPSGGVMFHHCQTLHYTPPNRTDRQRRAFAIHFMTPGTVRTRIDAATGETRADPMPVSYSRPLLRARI
jgi:phytanoyl-CoA hydroxylase